MKNKLIERFTLLKDGWIKDAKTGLDWGKSSLKEMNLKDAQEYCSKEGGRLPSRTELESIQDLEKYSPCIDAIFQETKSSYYWSGTKCAWNGRAAWCVSFGYGNVYCLCEDLDGCVRPVRASQ